jgi:Zn2+/Cd2+-exporting ATPase
MSEPVLVTIGRRRAPGPAPEVPEVAVTVGPRLVYTVSGLCCAEEIGTLKRVLKHVVPAEQIGFDVLNGTMTMPASVDVSAVVSAVAPTGMVAELRPKPTGDPEPPRPWWSVRELLTLASALALLAGVAVPMEAVSRAIYLVAIAAGLWLVLPKAWYALRTLRPDMNLLMTVAVIGAVALGEWLEGASVAFLFALSLTLEAWSVGRARRAVAALMSLAPDTARVIRGGHEQSVSPADVAVGEHFHVLPGERFPLDGRIVGGTSEVDQAPITGESVPVHKATDDEVFAGTINGPGALEVESLRASEDTTLARITRLVADSQARRSKAEQWVDRFARVYTPVVFASAAAVAFVPPLLGASWSDWIYRGLVLLVIGCPCALVISTPVSIVAALASAASNGVLVKGGRLMELPAALTTVALDKTGTLTVGRPRVVEVVALGEHTDSEVLARAAAVEQRSEHPVAQAIVHEAQRRGIEASVATDVRAEPGKGAAGLIGGEEFWVGSQRWLEERGDETPALHGRLVELSSAGRTVVAVGNQTHTCGLIALADGVRDDAKRGIAALHAVGIRRVVMLTGDNRPTALAIAEQVGIDDVRAELLPEDKVAAIEELGRDGVVAMVGDGVNDAPALAIASLGIAMGAAGTDVAIETADIALMGDDLGKLAWLIGHSRRTLSIIRQNTVFALAIKLVFVLLTFLGVATLWMAIAADMGASLLVVFNALRLLRPGPDVEPV